MEIDSKIENCTEPKIFAREVKIYVQMPDQQRAPLNQNNRKLSWTAPKVYLVELIYALQGAGVINNSTADLKELTEFFEYTFSVELGNIYNSFSEMRLRKKNRSVFLDLMRDRFIQRMDEADER